MAYVLGKKYVEGGVWFAFPGGGQFLIHRAPSNVEYARVKRELEHAAREKRANFHADGGFDPAVALDIAAESYARTIVKDWKDVKDEEGNEVPYTWELGKQLILADDQFSEWLGEIARDEAKFRAGEVDATAKK